MPPRRLTSLLLLALALAAAAFIWPTPYREYPFGQTTVRVNRFTGATEILRRADPAAVA